MVEDVNCYSAGVICRKSISINVGSSLIIFDDDSGDPVRTCTGEGWAQIGGDGVGEGGLRSGVPLRQKL